MTREDDSISRKEVLQMIDNIREAAGFIGFNTYSEAFDQVNNMSSVPRWIPVSERLPERRKNVLVTYETEFGEKIAISYFDKYGCAIGEAIAWMPLPKPYESRKRGRRCR